MCDFYNIEIYFYQNIFNITKKLNEKKSSEIM